MREEQIEDTLYRETWDGDINYPGFNDHLRLVEKYSEKHNGMYRLGNMIWSAKEPSRMNDTRSILRRGDPDFDGTPRMGWDERSEDEIPSPAYPSELFFRAILNIQVDKTIINKPILYPLRRLKSLRYISLTRNCLLTIDGLLHSGSKKRYPSPGWDRFMYSEHSGILAIRGGMIDNIVVSAHTTRIDENDQSIYLPSNNRTMKKGVFLFHTHPFTDGYGGRIASGIVYEVPSAGDLFNFIKYHNEGRAQASVVMAPEGIYVIRPIRACSRLSVPSERYNEWVKLIERLEQDQIKRLKGENVSDPDTFHKLVSADRTLINRFNEQIEECNLFIEYYRRVKIAGEWAPPPISLVYDPKR